MFRYAKIKSVQARGRSMSNIQTPVFGRRSGGLAPSKGYEYVPAVGQLTTQRPVNFSDTAEYQGASSTVDVIKKPVKGARFLSGIVDYIVVAVIGGGILGVFLGLTPTNITGPIILKLYLGLGIMSFLYGVIMESRFQGTFGKLATGTVIVNEDGSALSFGKVVARNFAKFISLIVPLGISYFMVLWTKDSQTVHDMIAGTFVYRKAKV